MSKTLREMAEEAFTTAQSICEENGHDLGSDIWISFSMARMAELVVEECCEIMVNVNSKNPGNTDNVLLSIEAIRNHFNLDK